MLEKFKIGHAQNEDIGSGVTVILSEEGAVGGVSVRGSAPATRETDLLASENSVEKINAVFLSGGSAFGLESSCGIMKYLRERNIGFTTGGGPVPIVCGACIYDLEYKTNEYPDIAMGYEACENAKIDNFESGSNIGCGTGATVGKILGKKSSQKSGLGVATHKFKDGLEMCAIVSVNALGDVYNYKNGKRVKGATLAGIPLNSVKAISNYIGKNEPKRENTTIGCIITNAKLTKPQANKLADVTHDGLAMAIRPVHTLYDGDTVFCMASGEIEADMIRLMTYAPVLMAEAILNAVK